MVVMGKFKKERSLSTFCIFGTLLLYKRKSVEFSVFLYNPNLLLRPYFLSVDILLSADNAPRLF